MPNFNRHRYNIDRLLTQNRIDEARRYCQRLHHPIGKYWLAEINRRHPIENNDLPSLYVTPDGEIPADMLGKYKVGATNPPSKKKRRPDPPPVRVWGYEGSKKLPIRIFFEGLVQFVVSIVMILVTIATESESTTSIGFLAWFIYIAFVATAIHGTWLCISAILDD